MVINNKENMWKAWVWGGLVGVFIFFVWIYRHQEARLTSDVDMGRLVYEIKRIDSINVNFENVAPTDLRLQHAEGSEYFRELRYVVPGGGAFGHLRELSGNIAEGGRRCLDCKG